jgi:hypothetical protein
MRRSASSAPSLLANIFLRGKEVSQLRANAARTPSPATWHAPTMCAKAGQSQRRIVVPYDREQDCEREQRAVYYDEMGVRYWNSL